MNKPGLGLRHHDVNDLSSTVGLDVVDVVSNVVGRAGDDDGRMVSGQSSYENANGQPTAVVIIAVLHDFPAFASAGVLPRLFPVISTVLLGLLPIVRPIISTITEIVAAIICTIAAVVSAIPLSTAV